jgi:hypothetical protein
VLGDIGKQLERHQRIVEHHFGDFTRCDLVFLFVHGLDGERCLGEHRDIGVVNRHHPGIQRCGRNRQHGISFGNPPEIVIGQSIRSLSSRA